MGITTRPERTGLIAAKLRFGRNHMRRVFVEKRDGEGVMATFRIAHIIANQRGGRSAVSESFTVPASSISPGFQVENVELLRNFSTLNDLDRVVLELAYAEAGLRAAKAGFDALLVTPFKDYGVRELRSAVDVPVIGGGQSAMQIAAGLGRFAVVTVYPPTLRGLYERHIAACGFEGHCSGVYFASDDHELKGLLGEGGEIRELGLNKRGALMDRIESASRRALGGGAQVIVLGCTCMSPIKAELEHRLGATTPVIDPLSHGYKFTEMMLSLGIKHQRTTPSAHFDELTAMISNSSSVGDTLDEACGESCSLISEGTQPA
jgi:allantoin racemase